MTWEDYRKAIINQKKVHEDWYVVGIDLGTTNSVMSYWSHGNKRPEPIDMSNGFGKVPMPSVVQYRKEEDLEEWVIGEEAYQSLKIYPETTISSIKRKMGSSEKLTIGNGAGTMSFLPEEISGMILKALIGHIDQLNPKKELAGLVVSVPYDFDDAAKKATIRACQLAGLSDALICLIEEPKAAALAYSFQKELLVNENIMIFDFGGGTLDITIFKVMEQNEHRVAMKVMSEGGEAYHGGDNVDALLMNRLKDWMKAHHIDTETLSLENQAELDMRARETKERLSGVKKMRVPFTFCVPPFVEAMTREESESLIQEFIIKTKELVRKALRDAYEGPILPEAIDRVILEGGSSQMPWVRQMLVEIFNDEEKIFSSERPALDISLGATYYAAMKMGILEHKELTATTKEVNFEVTVPHDIGFEITTGESKRFFTMIGRGTPYTLARKSQIFTLEGETPIEMTTLKLKILERMHKEDPIDKCRLIGDVLIEGLPERPSGKTKLKVSLSVDEEGGMVHGSVQDLGFNGIYKPQDFIAHFTPSYLTSVDLKE